MDCGQCPSPTVEAARPHWNTLDQSQRERLSPLHAKHPGAGALTGRSSPSSAEHTRAVILHYRTYGRYHISRSLCFYALVAPSASFRRPASRALRASPSPKRRIKSNSHRRTVGYAKYCSRISSLSVYAVGATCRVQPVQHPMHTHTHL